MTKDTTNTIKCIAVFLLIWHHLFWTGSVTDNELIIDISYLGKSCVLIYLLLSAYGLSKVRTNFSKYISDRIAKLLSAFYLIIAVVILLSLINSLIGYTNYIYSEDRPVIMFMVKLCLQLSGLHYLIGYKGFSSPWWYITLAVLCYLLHPIINSLYENKRNIMSYIACGMIVISFLNETECISNATVFGFKISFFVLIEYIGIYILGVGLAKDEVYLRLAKTMKGWSALFLFIVALIRMQIRTMNNFTTIIDLPFAILFIVFVLYLRQFYFRLEVEDNKVLSDNSNIFKYIINLIGKCFVKGGILSANVYLLHMVVIKYIAQGFSGVETWPMINFLLVTVISFALSFLLEKIKTLIQWNKITSLLSGLIRRIFAMASKMSRCRY